jgi:nucleotide-binding universal stress UspA family protein
MLREAEPVRGWLRGERPLKVFVAYNFSATADAALRWVKQLTRVGPCEVVLGYVNQPIEDHLRIGARGPLPFGENPPEVLSVLERDMKARARTLLGDVPVSCRVTPDTGRTYVRLAQLAREENADLIVAGARQYRGLQRWRHGSVSRALLKKSPVSVAVVPLATARREPAAQIAVRRHVLVATDFSAVGNAAIPHALALLPEGGLLTLMHVSSLPPMISEHLRQDLARDATAPSAERLALSSRLRQLIPADAAQRGILAQTEVVLAADVGQAISQTAERLSVDAICLSTGSRSEVSRTILGSVTRTVRSLTRRPLMLVPTSRRVARGSARHSRGVHKALSVLTNFKS